MRAALIGAHRSPIRFEGAEKRTRRFARCFAFDSMVLQRAGSGDIGDSQLTRSVRCGDCSSRAERSCRRPRASCSCRAPTSASHANMSNAVSESATAHATRSARCPLLPIRSCRLAEIYVQHVLHERTAHAHSMGSLGLTIGGQFICSAVIRG